jgi:hypothetical protein
VALQSDALWATSSATECFQHIPHNIQSVPGRKIYIFWEVVLSTLLKKNMCIYMCPIPNGFRDRAISLYSSLDLAQNIVLPSRRTAPLSNACESVCSVSWSLWFLTVTLEYCKKMPHIFTNAEYANMLYAVITRVAKCIDVDGAIFENVIF